MTLEEITLSIMSLKTSITIEFTKEQVKFRKGQDMIGHNFGEDFET